MYRAWGSMRWTPRAVVWSLADLLDNITAKIANACKVGMRRPMAIPLTVVPIAASRGPLLDRPRSASWPPNDRPRFDGDGRVPRYRRVTNLQPDPGRASPAARKGSACALSGTIDHGAVIRSLHYFIDIALAGTEIRHELP